MSWKRLARRALCIVTAALVLTASAASALTDISEFTQKQQELSQQQEALDKQLEEARKSIGKQQELKKALQEKIGGVEDEIDLLTSTISDFNKQVKQKEAQIAKQQAEIDADYETLGRRIRAVYMAGDASALEIILGAKDFDDFLDKAYLIESISDYDSRLIANLEKKLSGIQDEKEEIEREKDVVSQSKKYLEKKHDELDALQKECDAVLQKLSKTKGTLESKLEKNSEEQDKLSQELSEWHKQYVLQNGGIINGSPSPNGYIWPAPECNVITSYWGDDRSHKGMDFACNGSAYGKPIVAAQSGTVIRANKTDSWGSGWGYYIMVDHGGGFSTLYAHCSVVVAEESQQVQQGEIIGYIGNSGNSYGAHLHFECWFNGERYDPATELF